MLGLGWTEMLIVGVVALIVIGPKDLPDLMHKIGRFAGSIRKMGQDFQRELNKTTGLNEITNLRKSITEPLKATTDAIRKEFNTTTASGKVEPSGALKPADPNAESVVNELHAAAGMKPPQTPAEAMKEAVARSVANAPTIAASPAAAPAVKAEPVKAARPKSKTASASEEKPAKPKTKPKAKAAPKPIDSPAPVEAVAPAKAPRKRASKAAPAAVAAQASETAAAEPPAGDPSAVKAPTRRKPAAKKS